MLLACLAVFVMGLALVPSTQAQTTHGFVKQLTLEGGPDPMPLGVDAGGNIVVWYESSATIRKFSPSGAPVPFSALGTNVIDGLGAGNCPTVPSDCDQTPTHGLGGTDGLYGEHMSIFARKIAAGIDQSRGTPTSGYIYVEASEQTDPGQEYLPGFFTGARFRGHLYAFDSSGRYRGEVDQTRAFPESSPNAVAQFISVSPGGSLLVTYDASGLEVNQEDNVHVDQYRPVDGNPAHDAFTGQLRREGNGSGLNLGDFRLGAVSDDESVFTGAGYWEKFPQQALALPSGGAFPENLSPDGCQCPEAGPWHGGFSPDDSDINESASIDPETHHAYLFNAETGNITEWNPENEQVGIPFGGPGVVDPGSALGPLAFDRSGMPTDGRIYIRHGEKGLAVFGPPVVVPDIEAVEAVPTHTGGDILAEIDLAHGPSVSECIVQVREDTSSTLAYTETLPCDPPTPYNNESTDIAVHITGLTTEKDYRYRVLVRTINGVSKTPGLPLRPRAVLAVDTGSATAIDRTHATLHGSLDADGLPTQYYFQYGSDTDYHARTPAQPVQTPTGDAPVTPVELTNLQGGREYHYRLVAVNSLGTSYGPDRTFHAASAPSVSGVRASEVGETSASIHALINPSGYPASYHFEYGPTPDYGTTVPSTDEGIGGGTDPVSVSAQLKGLEPGRTYHFRVVATNQWGQIASDDITFNFFPEPCPNEAARQANRSTYLPDCRAYELVSGGNAGAVELLPGNTLTNFPVWAVAGIPHLSIPSSNQGGAISPARFSFLGAIGSVNGTNPPNSLIDMYTSTRTANGWRVKHWGLKGSEAAFVGGSECSLTMDRCIDYRIGDALGGDKSDVGSPVAYAWSAAGESLGRWPTNAAEVPNSEEMIGIDQPSPDFSHYVFSSRNVAFAQGGLTQAPGSMYDNNVAQKTVSIVSLRPNGKPIPVGSGGSSEVMDISAVSTDGGHILMSTSGAQGGSHLYMRVADSITYELAGGASVRFIGMTRDGGRVLFSSKEKLTAEDKDTSGDIYEWQEDGNFVRLISAGPSAGNSDACEASWTSKCSVVPLETERPDTDDLIAADSGDTYFFSPEQLDPSNPGLSNEKNLYLVHQGHIQYVTTLGSAQTIDRAQISPDGNHAAFLTDARLTTYDNQGWREMYGFSAQTGTLRCVSCIPSGEPPTIIRPALDLEDKEHPEISNPSADVMASQNGRFMSDDGRIAFATSDALVENDTDGVLDVYEYVDGRPQLISSGSAPSDRMPGNFLIRPQFTGLEAVSADGTDVYFSTYDTLVAEDGNGKFLKFYDARTGGGFPHPELSPTCVAADECHGSENPAPAAPTVATSAGLGYGGNAPLPRAHKRKHHKDRVRRRRSRHNKTHKRSSVEIRAGEGRHE